MRVLPYTLATLAGLLPGTAAVVVLGYALTGNVSPLLFLVSLCTASIGIAGLVYEIRTHRRHHRERVAESDQEPNQRSPADGAHGPINRCGDPATAADRPAAAATAAGTASVAVGPREAAG